MTTSAERLQFALLRALSVLRAGDELEALRVISEHVIAAERSDCVRTITDDADGAGTARKSRDAAS